MEGFRRSIFKLNMTKSPEGACISKLIPQNVEMDCLPSTQITANTESISTVDELKESMNKGIEFSASASVFGNSFSYAYSSETRSMVDTIVQLNSTVCFTRASMTWVRLSAFDPLLELHDQFRYVIDNMPCCNPSKELDQYIQELIIGYFGLAYVRDLLLGGFAQQKIIISEENKKNLREYGFTNTHQAELKVAAAAIFSASTKLAMTETYDKTQLSTFNRFTQQSSVITLGGSINMQSIEEWSKTVPSNPTIVKFGIASILDLLTAKRFPKDTKIASKRHLIQTGHEKYILSSLYCENKCSQHGSCEPTGSFGLGKCRCDFGWIGKNCSTIVRAPLGLLTNINSDDSCSTGYAVGFYDLGTGGLSSSDYQVFRAFKACSLTDKTMIAGSQKTFCGIVYMNLNISCDNINPKMDDCPAGYSKYSWSSVQNGPTTFWSCQKNNATLYDRSGTLCGFHSTFSGEKQVACYGFYLGQGKCPTGYTLNQTLVSFTLGSTGTISFCTKD